jgi:predicted Zn-dependent peptidase
VKRRTRRGAAPTFLLLIVGLLPPSEAHAQDVELQVLEHTLENGMRFLLLPREGSPTVSFVVHVPVGSVNESLGTTGIAHFLEHLLFKGSTTIGTRDLEGERRLFERMDAAHDSLLRARARLPEPDSAQVARLEDRIRELENRARFYVVGGEFDEILSRAGARGLNATTSYEATQYFVELPANRMELWFVLEADRMRNPVFREFFTERNVIAEERRARIENSPGGRLWEEHMAAAFRMHPYGVAPIGHMSDILAISRQDVEDYYRRYYGPDNTIVAIVGSFEPDSARVWADAYFGPLQPGGPPAPILAREPEQRGERRVEVVHDSEPQLIVGWKVPSSYHPDAPVLSVLSNLLAAGRDSRLYRRLVREDRLATSVTAGPTPAGRYPGLFTIQATPRAPHTPEEVEAAVYEELERLRREAPAEEELERVRTRLDAAQVRRLISNLGLAFQLAESEAFWGDWRETFRRHERMGDVQPEDIVRVVERYFVEEGRTVATLRRTGIAAEEDGDPGGVEPQ